MAMRDQIREAIIAGGATKKSLLELTGTTEKGLASQFTYLRMMGTCPKKKEDGTWEIVSTEEWEAHRSSGAGIGKVLTPKERVEKGEKRSKRAAAAYDGAKKRHEADTDNRLDELKFIKAQAELEIAEIELGKAETALAELPDEEVPDEETLDDNGPDEIEDGGLETDLSDEDLDELIEEDELQ